METGFIILAMVLTTVVGFVIGKQFGRLNKKPIKSQGIVYVYYDDTKEQPSLFLEPNVSVNYMVSQKQVTFDVIITD